MLASWIVLEIPICLPQGGLGASGPASRAGYCRQGIGSLLRRLQTSWARALLLRWPGHSLLYIHSTLHSVSVQCLALTLVDPCAPPRDHLSPGVRALKPDESPPQLLDPPPSPATLWSPTGLVLLSDHTSEMSNIHIFNSDRTTFGKTDVGLSSHQLCDFQHIA